MNVGLISLIAKQKTGIDNYTQSLVENLIKIGKANNLYLIRYKENQDEIYTKTHEVTIPKIPFKLMNILHLYFRLPYAISKIDINVLHFPAHEHTQIIPFFLKPKIKKILTIHDLTPLLHPETHTKPTVLLWNSTLRLIKNKIDMILANSQNTKNDCIKYLNIPEEKIKVIYHACD
ncbi:MAG: glycosyltransferase, partial [Candidatus Nanoarchaeia archaeon]